MKKVIILSIILLVILANCSKSDPEAEKDPCDIDSTACGCAFAPPNCNSGENVPIGTGQPGTVGISGIESWNKLSQIEKNKINGWNSLFVHASVGTDLEDGAESNGFKFNFYDGKTLSNGLNGTDWKSIGDISNSEGAKKIAAFKAEAIKQKSKLQIVIFKFGYADINDDNLEEMKTLYKQMIDELRTAKFRFVHITPPLVYIVTKDDGNAAKMKMAQWMKDNFRDKDIIFDLQEIESDNGACKLGSVWTICGKYRSTAQCPSKGQGIDAPEGQGHLCEKEATRISKAFLMSIYNAGK